MVRKHKKVVHRYGRCGLCAAPILSREDKSDGNDVCQNGHTLPSRMALTPEGTRARPSEPLDPSPLAHIIAASSWADPKITTEMDADLANVFAAKVEYLLELLGDAFVVISNTHGGNWDLAERATGWKKAAEKWRDRYGDVLVAAADAVDDMAAEKEKKQREREKALEDAAKPETKFVDPNDDKAKVVGEGPIEA